MKIPILQGIIKRRILVNYRAQPDAVRKILPDGFRPKLHKGKAIAGICLIRLEHIRPTFAPGFVGFASENAAHRVAVEWEDENGKLREGVYIPRRDTDSLINSIAGGRLFPGEHHRAAFQIEEQAGEIKFSMRSENVEVKLSGKKSEKFPETSVFESLAEASNFFEKGALGFSATKDAKSLDALILRIENWKAIPLEVAFVESSFYRDETNFPKGSIEFDHALLMENVAHEWHGAKSFEVA